MTPEYQRRHIIKRTITISLFEPPHGKTNNLHMRKQRRRSAKLISAFVFATRIVQLLYFLNPKFQASSQLLCLYSPVCVRPVRKPHCLFSHETAHLMNYNAFKENPLSPRTVLGNFRCNARIKESAYFARLQEYKYFIFKTELHNLTIRLSSNYIQ